MLRRALLTSVLNPVLFFDRIRIRYLKEKQFNFIVYLKRLSLFSLCKNMNLSQTLLSKKVNLIYLFNPWSWTTVHTKYILHKIKKIIPWDNFSSPLLSTYSRWTNLPTCSTLDGKIKNHNYAFVCLKKRLLVRKR